MKALLIGLSLALLPLPVLAQVGTPAPATEVRYSKDEQAVLAAHETRRQAVLNNDFPVLEKVLSDRLAYIHSSGTVDTKAAFLTALKSGASRYERLDLRNTEVHYGAKLSVVAGEITIQLKTPDRTILLAAYYTAIYTRDKKNGWQLHRWQTTRLPAAQQPEQPK